MTNLERYRQQHMSTTDMMCQLSSCDKQRLLDAFNAGWAESDHGRLGVDSYDPDPVDKVLAEITSERDEHTE